MDIVVGGTELHGHDALLLVVEGQLRHVGEIVVELVLTAVDDNVGPLLNLAPCACLGIHLAQQGCSHILGEAAGLVLILGHGVVGLLEIGLDTVVDLVAAQVAVGNGLRVVNLCEIRNALEDTIQVEVVPGTKGLQFAQQRLFAVDVSGVVDGLHSLVNTGDAQVVVLPLVVAGGVIAGDILNLQLVDVTFHRDTLAALVGVVGAYVEYPVGDGTGKGGIVVIEEVCLEPLIG